MDKINILYVIPQLNIGGAELQLLKLIKGLDKKQYNIFLINLDKNAIMLEKEYKEAGAKILDISKEGKFDFIIIFKIRKAIRKYKIKVIHSFLNNTWSRIACIGMKNMPKILIGERSIDDWWKKWYHFSIDRFLLRYTDYITCNSDQIKEYYKEKLKIEDEKFKVIYNGIEIEDYIFSKEEVEESKKRYITNSNDIIFAIIGSLRDVKDHMTLLKAVRSLKEENITNFKVFIIGDGHRREEYENYVKENDIDDLIVFKGNIRPVNDILKCIDVGLSTSIQEGLSNSIIEFCVSGKKVISTKVGGNIELIIEGENGYFINVGDYKELASLMKKFLNQEISTELNKEKLENFRDKFEINKMIYNYDLLYKEE